MAIRMHDRKAARIIGEPYFRLMSPPKTKTTAADEPVGVLILTEAPKRVKVQDIEYVTSRWRVTVRFDEIYDPREPEEMHLARLGQGSI
jgi:hypothetical protein